MEFSIDGRTLKGMVEKVQAIIPKTTYIDEVEIIAEDDKVYCRAVGQYSKIMGMVSVHSEADVKEDGKVSINKNNLKMVLKMTGLVHFSIEEEGKVRVKNKNKTMDISTSDMSFEDMFPVMTDAKTDGKFGSLDLMDSLVNLNTFASNDDVKEAVCCINFNWKRRRIESLDGVRLCWKKINDNDVSCSGDTWLLHSGFTGVLKKVLNERKNTEVIACSDNECIYFVGKDFVFTQKKSITDHYFNTDALINAEYSYSFIADVKDILAAVGDSKDLLKPNKKASAIFGFYGYHLYIRSLTEQIDNIDKIKINDIDVPENFVIFINPSYIHDVLKIVDEEKVKIKMSSNKLPIKMESEDYGFIVLPVKTEGELEASSIQKFKSIEYA